MILFQFNYLDISIQVISSKRHSWNRMVCFYLNRQTKKMPQSNFSAKYKINIKDFNSLKFDEPNRLTESTFESDGVFFDIQSKFGISFHNDSIDVWVGRTPNISIPFLINLLNIRLRKTFVHCAAVERSGLAFLLPALGGVGKTLLISKLLDTKDYMLFGDDLALLSDSKVEPYLRPFCIYQYHDNLLNNDKLKSVVYKSPSLLYRIFRKLHILIYSFLNVDIKRFKDLTIKGDYCLVSPFDIFEDHKLSKSSAPLAAVIFLKKSSHYKGIVFREVDSHLMASMIRAVTVNEWPKHIQFLNVIDSYMDTEFSYLTQLESIVYDQIKEKPCFVCELPNNYNPDEYVTKIDKFITKYVS